MDTLTPKERSQRMSLVRGKDTKPELRVRRFIHSLGYRYRLHDSTIPGKPDLVFRSRGKVIFVHGCFWHRHPGCRNTRWPKSKIEFWKPKLTSNRKRDLSNQKRLKKAGWKFLIVWECETGNLERLEERIVGFLEE